MKDTDDGFTLVEVVVSLAIFVLVAGAATFAIVSSIRASDATDQRVVAAFIAEQELDRVRALGPNPVFSARPLATGYATASDGLKFTVGVKATPDWATACYIGSVLGTGTGFRNLEIAVSLPNGRISPLVLDSRIGCGSATP